MADKQKRLRPHFVLSLSPDSERYQPISRVITTEKPPEQDRKSHGSSLLGQLSKIKVIAEQAKSQQTEMGMPSGLGLQLVFSSLQDIEMPLHSLSDARAGIELMNVHRDEHHTYATVFVPDGKLIVFEKKVQEYLEQRKNRDGKSLDHSALINTIKEIRVAAFNELWTDDNSVLPISDQELIWWEIWLPVLGNRAGTINRFRTFAEQIGFEVSKDQLEFPERTVLLMQGTLQQIQQSMILLNNIAEIKRAKETAEFFDSLSSTDQREWVDELLGRTYWPENKSPYVCILDTGVNSGHPLIKPALDDADLHTIEPAWGVADQCGHGTEMAGLALWGDLTEAFVSSEPIRLSHRLESVKLLPQDGANSGRHHGKLTLEGISRVEVSDPYRLRVFNLAVTAKDNRDRGKPSAWSSTLDSQACDTDNEWLTPRLIVVSAGNIDDHNAWIHYPESNASDSIHDPAQAWNCLTVGAYTEKVRIIGDDANNYSPLAELGGLSPFSTTSVTWPKQQWPLKPDVVFEGGNLARTDQYSAPYIESKSSLSLLTTDYQLTERLLTVSNRTSAATALCSRMAAQLMEQYPSLWPETIRGLIVHSAEWTEQMKNDFLGPRKRSSDYENLIRQCGFGMPNLEKAMWSAKNSLSLIVENQLQPFSLEVGKNDPTFNDMHLYELPWPDQELMALGETRVEMKVTLSYFIEPNPGIVERGNAGRYRYESHGLRFDVKRPTETILDFKARNNQIIRKMEEGSYTGGGSDTNWALGSNLRHLGSLHSDIWTGTAADLARRGVLAVYPVTGWWKTHKKLKSYNKKARYAFIVSINTPETGVDLYNAIEKLITPVSIEV